MLYIANAFSLQMLPVDKDCTLEIKNVTIADVVKAIALHGGIHAPGVVSCIGHEQTAAIVAGMFNKYAVPHDRGCECWDALSVLDVTKEDLFHRQTIQLVGDEPVFVCQVVGGRLAEGCTELPEGTQLVWKRVICR